MKKKWIVYIISLGLLLDIVSKLLVKHFLTYGVPKNVLGSFLRFTYVENSGVVFGIGHTYIQAFPIIKNVCIVLFACVIILFLLKEYRNTSDTFSKVLYIFIFTGALGNLIERIFGNIYYNGEWKLFFGKVVDFIDVGFGENYRWFIFNIADSYISVSVCLLILRLWFLSKQKTTLEEK